MPVLSISSLIPERHSVDFGDGQLVEIVSWNELHALDLGYLANLQGRMEKLIDAALKDGDDPGVQANRTDQLNQILTDTLCYVMPDAQRETLEALSPSTKQKIINWWRRQEITTAADDPNADGQG